MAQTKNQDFPDEFLWGASTSSHQVEGGNHNQWTVWELENAVRLAAEAEKHYSWLPIWDEIKAEAKDPNNYVSGEGVDHYQLYETDFDLARELNLNAFRFGIEWSRIEPAEGQWNAAAIGHYKKYIAALKQRGLQPVINLWHWTAPVWFEDKGGFTKRANLGYFQRFVERIAEELIVPCGIVITVNEPNSYVGMSLLEGQWPPQRRSPYEAIKAFLNFATAHKRTYDYLKKLDPTLRIGVAAHCNNSRPKRAGNWEDRAFAKLADYLWDWWFLNRIKNHQDFVGINYYHTDYFRGFLRKNPQYRRMGHMGRGIHALKHNPPGPLNDLGWYMEPGGIYRVIMTAAKRYKKPIMITENGVADRHDQYRQWWLEETLAAIGKANRGGAQIIGYLHWSLLDNFEWSQGWWPQFGLIKVDRSDNMKRSVRPSAKWLADQIAKHSRSHKLDHFSNL